MKKRRLYMFLCGILLAVQTIRAQQNMFVMGNTSRVNAISTSSVKYATFNANDKWLAITYDGIVGTRDNLISAVCTVGLSADSEVKSLYVTPEVGVCYSKDRTLPTIADKCISLGSELKSYTFSMTSLVSGTTYYFRPYVKLAKGVLYGDVASAKTLGDSPADKSKNINGHKFVDLGLPSGLLWAETNIGAETAADDGNYYAWGETEPQTSNNYSWFSYKYGSSDLYLTKYNSSDKKTVLDEEDDAAYVNWGTSCRIPTCDDYKELYNSDNCTWYSATMTTSSGASINGYKITSTRNCNSIFLPKSGIRGNGGLGGHGEQGYYWTSICIHSEPDCIWLYDDGYSWSSRPRYCGLTVRPVAEP